MKKLLKWANRNPKEVFMIDGIGAIGSALTLAILSVSFERLFDISKPILYVLIMLPIFFAVYDFYCYLNFGKRIKTHLKIIAYANLLYCFLSIGVITYHVGTITYWGWIYFSVEIAIVSFLARLELKIAQDQTND